MQESNNTEQGVCSVPKGVRLKVECLEFADDLALLTEGKGEVKRILEKLHEVAYKTGIRIWYEKQKTWNTNMIKQYIWRQGL